MKLHEHELAARQALAAAGTECPGLCGRLLVQYAAGLDRNSYLLATGQELDSSRAAFLSDLISRRIAGEPMAYITGRKEFYSRDFLVSPAVLIPRPDTELLIELALAKLPPCPIIFADFGCGSGCIGLTLLCERPEWRGLLIDISFPALAIASQNSRVLGCNAALLHADIFQTPLACESLDLLISNPPYIAATEKTDIAGETLAWEPHLALFSESAGLAHLEAVIRAGRNVLKADGYILLEHGYRQREAVTKLLVAHGFGNISAANDLAGLPRAVIAQKQGG